MNEQSISDMDTKAVSAQGNGQWHSPVDYDKVVEAAERIFNRTSRRAQVFARQYPVQVAAGALAVGIVLGATLFRRRA
jgi:hypothetical protein